MTLGAEQRHALTVLALLRKPATRSAGQSIYTHRMRQLFPKLRLYES